MNGRSGPRPAMMGWWACQDLNLGPHPYQGNQRFQLAGHGPSPQVADREESTRTDSYARGSGFTIVPGPARPVTAFTPVACCPFAARHPGVQPEFLVAAWRPRALSSSGSPTAKPHQRRLWTYSDGAPSARQVSARLFIDCRVSGWSSPSTRRRPARACSSSASACRYWPLRHR